MMKEFFTSGQFLGIIDYILYFLLIGVTGWIVYQMLHAPLRDRFSQARYRSKLRRARMFSEEIPLSKRSPFYRNIYFLLEAVRPSKKNSSQTNHLNVYTFFLISFLLGFLTLVLIVVKFQDAFIGIIIGGMVSMIPYVTLQVHLRNSRNAVGNQLTETVEVLIHAYSSSANDMYQALKITHSHLQEKELRKIFIRLITDLQTAQNEEEMRLSIDLFIYTCGNSWSMRLGNIILKSYLFQENVLNALLQLQTQMINNEKMLEEEKSGSYDAFYDALLAVILFPVSLIGANYIIMKPQSWTALQFGENALLLTFIITTLTVVIAFLVGFLIRKPKNDL